MRHLVLSQARDHYRRKWLVNLLVLRCPFHILWAYSSWGDSSRFLMLYLNPILCAAACQLTERSEPAILICSSLDLWLQLVLPSYYLLLYLKFHSFQLFIQFGWALKNVSLNTQLLIQSTFHDHLASCGHPLFGFWSSTVCFDQWTGSSCVEWFSCQNLIMRHKKRNLDFKHQWLAP